MLSTGDAPCRAGNVGAPNGPPPTKPETPGLARFRPRLPGGYGSATGSCSVEVLATFALTESPSLRLHGTDARVQCPSGRTAHRGASGSPMQWPPTRASRRTNESFTNPRCRPAGCRAPPFAIPARSPASRRTAATYACSVVLRRKIPCKSGSVCRRRRNDPPTAQAREHPPLHHLPGPSW